MKAPFLRDKWGWADKYTGGAAKAAGGGAGGGTASLKSKESLGTRPGRPSSATVRDLLSDDRFAEALPGFCQPPRPER